MTIVNIYNACPSIKYNLTKYNLIDKHKVQLDKHKVQLTLICQNTT
jgi:hypothetical protein